MPTSVTRPRDYLRGFRCYIALGVSPALLLCLTACGSDAEPAARPSTAQTTSAIPTDSNDQDHRLETREATTSGPSPGGRFDNALHGLLAGDSDPSREQIADSLKSVGFAPEEVEISNDTTPTGLDVDAMEVAVQIDGKCLVAQLRGGEADVTSLPVLASGHCFVGDQR